MTFSVTNSFLHKYALKAVLPFILRNRFIVEGEYVKQRAVCISFDCENVDDMKRIPSLSDKLKDNNIATSFALRGDLLFGQENIVKGMLKNRHEIINHTFSHPPIFRLMDAQKMRKEIESFQMAAKEKFGCRPEGFRAPHLMRKYNGTLFQILKENQLYDSSYIGWGVSSINGVVEIPLTSCPHHPQLCFDYAHHFQLPLRSGLKKFFELWEYLLKRRKLVNIYLDPRLTSDAFLQEMLVRIPEDYRFCRVRDIVDFK